MKRKSTHTPGGVDASGREIAMCGLFALYMVPLDEFRKNPNRCRNCERALGELP